MRSIGDHLSSARTFLFVPGSRPDWFAKATASGADLVVIDLEDAVEPERKAAARSSAHEWLSGGNPAVVRVNRFGSSHWDDDIAMVSSFDVSVMIPKSEDVNVVANVAARHPVVALVETAQGVLAAAQLSAVHGVVRTAIGHIDLAAELGVSPDMREAFSTARSTLILAAAANGMAPPVDGVTTALDNIDRLRSDLAYAKGLGMGGKLCIHPSQVKIARSVLSPSESEVDWARNVIGVQVRLGGALKIDGQMVDPPVIARAERILRSTGES